MSRSPRCSDRARQTCVFPWPMLGVPTPFPQTRREHVTFHRRSKSMGFLSPREKTRFSKTGWDCARRALACHGLSPAAGSASRGPRNPVTPSRPCGPRGPKTCSRPTHTSAGDQRQNEGTDNVERLKDNPRGFSVVIYNRDCKMVNQRWS